MPKQSRGRRPKLGTARPQLCECSETGLLLSWPSSCWIMSWFHDWGLGRRLIGFSEDTNVAQMLLTVSRTPWRSPSTSQQGRFTQTASKLARGRPRCSAHPSTTDPHSFVVSSHVLSPPRPWEQALGSSSRTHPESRVTSAGRRQTISFCSSTILRRRKGAVGTQPIVLQGQKMVYKLKNSAKRCDKKCETALSIKAWESRESPL